MFFLKKISFCVQIQKEEVAADCKYQAREICRAPLLLLEEFDEVKIDDAVVANFAVGQHELR